MNSYNLVKTDVLYICKFTESVTIKACGIKVLLRCTLEHTIKTLKIAFMIVLLYYYFFKTRSVLLRSPISTYPCIVRFNLKTFHSAWISLLLNYVGLFHAFLVCIGLISFKLGILISVLVEELVKASFLVKGYCF